MRLILGGGDKSPSRPFSVDGKNQAATDSADEGEAGRETSAVSRDPRLDWRRTAVGYSGEGRDTDGQDMTGRTKIRTGKQQEPGRAEPSGAGEMMSDDSKAGKRRLPLLSSVLTGVSNRKSVEGRSPRSDSQQGGMGGERDHDEPAGGLAGENTLSRLRTRKASRPMGSRDTHEGRAKEKTTPQNEGSAKVPLEEAPVDEGVADSATLASALSDAPEEMRKDPVGAYAEFVEIPGAPPADDIDLTEDERAALFADFEDLLPEWRESDQKEEEKKENAEDGDGEDGNEAQDDTDLPASSTPEAEAPELKARENDSFRENDPPLSFQADDPTLQADDPVQAESAKEADIDRARGSDVFKPPFPFSAERVWAEDALGRASSPEQGRGVPLMPSPRADAGSPAGPPSGTMTRFPKADALQSLTENFQWLEDVAKGAGTDKGEAHGGNPSALGAERALVGAAKERLRSVLKILTQSQTMVNETTKRLRELEIAEMEARLAADAASTQRRTTEQDTEQAIATARRLQDAVENDVENAIAAIELRRHDTERAATELVRAAEHRRADAESAAQTAIAIAKARQRQVEEETAEALRQVQQDRRQVQQEAAMAVAAARSRIEEAEQYAKTAVELVSTRQVQAAEYARNLEDLARQIQDASTHAAEARAAAEAAVAFKDETEHTVSAAVAAAEERRRLALAEEETLNHTLEETRQRLEETERGRRNAEEVCNTRLSELKMAIVFSVRDLALAKTRHQDAEMETNAAIEAARLRQSEAERRAEEAIGAAEAAEERAGEAETSADEAIEMARTVQDAARLADEDSGQAQERLADLLRREATARNAIDELEKALVHRREEAKGLLAASEAAATRRREAEAIISTTEKVLTEAQARRQEAEAVVAGAEDAAAQAEERWAKAQQATAEAAAAMKRRLLEAEETIAATRDQTHLAQEKYWQILEEAQSALTTIEDRVIQAEKLYAILTAAAADAEVRRLEAERALQEIAATRLREEQNVVSLRHERGTLQAETLRMTEDATRRRRQILVEAITSGQEIIEAAARQASGDLDQQILDTIIANALTHLEAAAPRELPGPSEEKPKAGEVMLEKS